MLILFMKGKTMRQMVFK